MSSPRRGILYRSQLSILLGIMSIFFFKADNHTACSTTLLRAAAMPNPNTAAVARDGFAYQGVEGLPVEPAVAVVRHRRQIDSRRSNTSVSAHFHPFLAVTASTGGFLAIPLARNWRQENTLCPPCRACRGNLRVLLLIVVPLACFGLICGLMPTLVEPMPIKPPRSEPDASFERLIERIVMSESQGDPSAKNKRSTATGLGQFLDQTWLELIRAHRRELFTGRTEREVLSLRKNSLLSREMTRRFIERNAAALTKHGLPVTPSTLYLAHFAGPAGAVAILAAPGDADAAAVIASADSRAEITRAKILNGNPFLRGFTVEDLRNWVNMKTEGLAIR
jgi:hypothetical protein